MIPGATTTPKAESESRIPRLLRSVLAVLAGSVTIVVLSLGIDLVLRMLGVYPPAGEPMYSTGLNLLALSYRIVISIFGCYLAARLAPRSPMRHAIALGVVGVIVSAAGAMAAISTDMGPIWYPVALVIIALPCAWLGGVVERRSG